MFGIDDTNYKALSRYLPDCTTERQSFPEDSNSSLESKREERERGETRHYIYMPHKSCYDDMQYGAKNLPARVR